MARKTTSQLLQEIAALLPDNTSELISPADIRQCLNDICDSFTPAWGVMRRVASTSVNLTVTPVKLGVFDEVVVTSPELTVSIANDVIIASNAGFYTFNFTASIAGTNNSDVQVEIRRNGLQTFWAALSTTTGAANRAEITLAGIIQATAGGDEFSVYVNVLSGSDNADFFNTQLTMSTIQTIN